MLVLLCSFFMFGCSTGSEDAVNITDNKSTDIAVEENTIEQVQMPTKLSSTKTNLNTYFALIDRPLEELESLCGQADVKDVMYGGDFYYYDKLEIGFGVDGDIVTSIYIYEGELDNGIKVNMSLEEALKILQLSQADVEENEYGIILVFSKYHSYDAYLSFDEGKLQEILIKKS